LQHSEASTLINAATWIQDMLQGPLATALAVIAIAGVGMLMLYGQSNWRLGARTIVGCFILFGAPAIAAGMMSAADYRGRHTDTTESSVFTSPELPPSLPGPQSICWNCGPVQPTQPADPYAGAAIGN